MKQHAIGAILLFTIALEEHASGQNHRFPLEPAGKYITAYYDLGGTTDWNCGKETYSGHTGSDYGVGSWPGMGAPILAGAAGTVTATHDGEFDQCTTGTCAAANHVKLQHADGKVTLYTHMKKGSVAVSTGQKVTCGQKLGGVGSSGPSTGPHLHFGINAGAGYDDPFTGPCGGPLTWWVAQGPYKGLPSTQCDGPAEPPPPPKYPVFALGTGIETIAGQPPDVLTDNGSAGIFDIGVSQSTVQHFDIKNAGSAAGSNVTVGFWVEQPYITVAEWTIWDDWEHPGTFELNDTNDKQPISHQNPGETFQLKLGGMSPGETKRVRLTVQALAESVGKVDHPDVRMWVIHVDNYYEKADFWSGFNNVSGYQTFNGGDLRVWTEMDVFCSPIFCPPPSEPDVSDSQDTQTDDTQADSGASALLDGSADMDQAAADTHTAIDAALLDTSGDGSQWIDTGSSVSRGGDSGDQFETHPRDPRSFVIPEGLTPKESTVPIKDKLSGTGTWSQGAVKSNDDQSGCTFVNTQISVLRVLIFWILAAGLWFFAHRQRAPR